MTGNWKTEKPVRVDRYIDWSFRMNPHGGDKSVQGYWSAAAITLKHLSVRDEAEAGDNSQLLKNIGLVLAAAAKKMAVDNTAEANDLPTLRVTAEEWLALEKLAKRVSEITKLSSALEREDGFNQLFKASGDLEFFIYLPDSDIYQLPNEDTPAKFSDFDQFIIRFASPPIEGLRFRTEPPQTKTESGACRLGDALIPPAIIGVIDDGISFANRRFRAMNEDDKPLISRIHHLWLQDTEKAEASDLVRVNFGSQFNHTQINELLNSASDDHGDVDEKLVYRNANAFDFSNEYNLTLGRQQTHGGFVMDLAAGHEPEGLTGVEPAILAVQLPTSITKDTSGQSLANYVIQGLRQMTLWADELSDDRELLPLVVNFSYGFQAGPKDGSSILEWEMEKLIRNRNLKGGLTHIVFPSGNSYEDRTSARITLGNKKTSILNWVIQPDDSTSSFLEIWMPRNCYNNQSIPLDLEITLPSCSSPMKVPNLEDGNVADLTMNNSTICSVYFDQTKPPSDWMDAEGQPSEGQTRSRILIAIKPTSFRNSEHDDEFPAPAGHWGLKFTGKQGHEFEAELHIQRDDTLTNFRPGGRQSYFEDEWAFEQKSCSGEYDEVGENSSLTHQNTISALSTGHSSITVGAASTNLANKLRASSSPSDSNPHTDDFEWPPSNYSAQGKAPNITGPYASAVCDYGEVFPGIYASGVLSGSTALLNGTSVAAPQFTRALAKHNGNLSSLFHAQSSRAPSTTHPHRHSRLGKFILNTPSFPVPDTDGHKIANTKRRYF